MRRTFSVTALPYPGSVADLEGKFLYDITATKLAAQCADHSLLTGRAKDLIGLTTLTTTIGAFVATSRATGNTARLPDWYTGGVLITVVVIIGCGLYVLLPRRWNFSPDPLAVRAALQTDPNLDSIYMRLAEGHLAQPAPAEGTKRRWRAGRFGPSVDLEGIEFNKGVLSRLATAVRVQVVGVSALAVLGAIVALVEK